MAGHKTRSAHSKALCKAYKTSDRRILNKKKKIAKHLKNHPNDLQSAKALKGDNFAPKNPPRKPHWSHTAKSIASLMSQAGYKAFYHAWHADRFTLLDSNRGNFGKVAAEIISAKWRAHSINTCKTTEKVSFALKERARFYV